MTHTPTPEQLDRCVRVEQLCAAIWQRRATARCAGYMRVRSQGRERELILGSGSLDAGGVTLIDWESAPLAEVFLAHEIGDEYDLELDEQRSVEGVVLDRAILRTRPHVGSAGGGEPALELAEIDDGQCCLRRSADGWQAEPSRLIAPMPLRGPGTRSHTRSAIEVELDDEQRRGVELAADRSLLILGEAGFGKTTVALHRLAHLRKLARADGRPFSALVLVPTRGLARLVKALLERLDVRDAEVRSFPRWAARQARRVFTDLPARESEAAPVAVSRVKRHPAVRALLPEIVRGTAAMREVAGGYRDDEVVRTGEQLLHLFGDRALLERAAAQAGGAIGPRMINQVIAHTRIQFSPTTEHAHADVDADRLRTVDGQAIDAGTPLHDAETIDTEDYAVLFELLQLRTGASEGPGGALERYDHIVVDEAQEFAEIELALIGRARAEGGTLSIAGDEHQQIDETVVFCGWPRVVEELGVADRCEHLMLLESYRCPPVVEAFARTLFESLPASESDIDRSDPVRSDPALRTSACAHELELVSVLIRALLDLRQHDRLASVAVVCRHASSARRMVGLLAKGVSCRLVVDGDFRFGPGISVTCVDEVKGLEFDYVIVPDANAANYPDGGEGRRGLYVAVTRASARLWLLWSGRVSPLLGLG